LIDLPAAEKTASEEFGRVPEAIGYRILDFNDRPVVLVDMRLDPTRK
jgi:hypothetical protein